MSEYGTSVRFESDGIHIWVKIGDHCRAMLGPPAEDRLREWLQKRRQVEMFGASSCQHPQTAITLPATRVSTASV